MRNIYNFILVSFLFISNSLFSQISDNIIIAQPTEIVKCAGTSGEYLEIMVSIDLNQYDYYVQWYKENQKFGEPFKNISRLNLPQFNHPLSAKFYAEVWVVDKNSDPFTNILKTEKSNDVLVYVLTKTEIIKHPKTVEKVKLGDNVEFSFDAHVKGIIGSKNNQEVIIEWFKGSKKLVDDNRITGTKSSILSISKIQQSDFGLDYRVVVTGECGTDTTDYFGIVEFPRLYWWSIGWEIKCAGEEFMIIYCTNITDNSPLKKQWYQNGKLLIDGPGVRGSNSDTLFIVLYQNDTIENEVISLKHGISDRFTMFNSLHLGYLDSSSAFSPDGLYVNQGPIVYRQPVNLKLKEKENSELMFYVDHFFNTKTQWFKDGVYIGDGYWGKLFLYNVTKAKDEGLYYCVSTNDCFSVTSDTVIVEVEESAFMTSVEQEFENSGIAVYPNPVESNSKLIMNVEEIGNVNIEIISTTGQKIGDFQFQANEIGRNIFDLNFDNFNLSNGVYLLNIQTQNKNYSKVINYIR